MEDNFRPDNHLLNKVLLYSEAYTNAQFCSPRVKDAFQKAAIVQKRKSSICNLDFIFIGLSPNINFSSELCLSNFALSQLQQQMFKFY